MSSVIGISGLGTTSVTLNVSNLKPGMYVLRVADKSFMIRKI
ncbi:MAG: hypothetical protein Kow0075_14790 [Salibacteraceae bacterium]